MLYIEQKRMEEIELRLSKKVVILLILVIYSSTVFANVNLEKVSLQLNWKYQFEYAGFIIAKEKGFYKNIGFDVELIEHNKNTDTINDVLQNKTTFGISDSMLMIERGSKDIVLLANYIKESPLVVATNILITHPKDLENKILMLDKNRMKNTPLDFMFRHLGVDYNKIIFKENSYHIEELIDKKVDAMEVYKTNEVYLFKKLGIKYNLLAPKDYGFNSGSVNLFTSKYTINTIGNNRIKEFIDASNKGWEYAFNNIDKTIDLIYNKYNGSLKKSKDALKYEALELKKLFLLDLFEIGEINKKELYRWSNILQNYAIINNENRFQGFLFNQRWKDKLYTQNEIDIFIILVIIFILITSVLLYISKMKEKILASQQNILKYKIEEALIKNIKQQQILQQQSKMAQMGEMIGAIAHQWRQPLNELGLSIQNLKYDYKFGKVDEKFITEFIEYNRKTIMFMSETIDDFRGFFRVEKDKKNFNIKEITESVVSMISAQFKNYQITVTIEGDEFIYNGLQSEYKQVILNIINNAKDALIEKKINNPNIKITLKKKTIIIKDNAGGIPNDIIDRVFEPYFTTKEQGKGTGMGLYMSKMIIEDNMGGSLSVENDNNGAVFRIKL